MKGGSLSGEEKGEEEEEEEEENEKVGSFLPAFEAPFDGDDDISSLSLSLSSRVITSTEEDLFLGDFFGGG